MNEIVKTVGPFPARVKPVYGGVYRRDIAAGAGKWAKWQDGEWKVQCDTYKQALKENRRSSYQNAYFKWCGVEF